jgi:23S rRNA (cytidine1920-2'-O)/16S rRNA (cytidine1409-2'-O)-methyltransferase
VAAKKVRLDLLVGERFPHYSRRQIQSWIMQGKIRVDEEVITKAGAQVFPDVALQCDVEEPRYVSRAGFKLEKALDEFNIIVVDCVCLDAGISTGGFTDCLLQRGVGKVFGVDVGHGQVHEKVSTNDRVILLENTNLRDLMPDVLGELVDLVTLDLSFISVLKVMEAVVRCIRPNAQLVVLIKPQFEARRIDVGRGGIIKNAAVHAEVVERVTAGIQAFGFKLIGVIESPITGTMGNKEFLAYFMRSNNSDQISIL